MPVFMVHWEIDGWIPVEAADADAARLVAEDIRLLDLAGGQEAMMYPIREVKCIEEARHVMRDPEPLNAEEAIYTENGVKYVGDVLPSDPAWKPSWIPPGIVAKRKPPENPPPTVAEPGTLG